MPDHPEPSSSNTPTLSYTLDAPGLRDRRASSSGAPEGHAPSLSAFRSSAREGNQGVVMMEETFEDEAEEIGEDPSKDLKRFPSSFSTLKRPDLPSPLPSFYTQSPSGPNTRAPSLHVEENGPITGEIVLPKKYTWRLVSSMLAYGTAGFADGTPGAILPHIEATYNLSYIQVSTLFVAATCGFLTGAFLNEPLLNLFGMYPLPSISSEPAPRSIMGRLDAYRFSAKAHSVTRGRALVLAFACSFQMLYFIIAASHPPFYGMLIAFACGGVGVSIVTGQLNAYIAASPINPGRNLGFLHGGYGVGAFLSPIISTTLIASGWPWWRFYFISFALASFNTVNSFIAFYPDAMERQADLDRALQAREIEMQLTERVVALNSGATGEMELEDGRGEEVEVVGVVKASGVESGVGGIQVLKRPGLGQRKSTSAKPKTTMGRTLKLPFVWFLALFLFVTCGYETTTGGWIVTFLLQVRNAPEKTAGYAASGFWGGLTLGRFASGLISPYLKDSTEKHLVHVFIGVCIIADFIVWFVPDVFAGAFATAIIGFCQGPIFPTSVMMATKLLPRDCQMTALSFSSSSASIGSAIYPFALGAIASAGGVKVLQPFLVALLSVMGILWTAIPEKQGYPSNLKFGIATWPSKVKGLFGRKG